MRRRRQHHRGHKRLGHAADLVAQPWAHRPRKIKDRQGHLRPARSPCQLAPARWHRAGRLPRARRAAAGAADGAARRCRFVPECPPGWRRGHDHQDCGEGHGQDRQAPARPPFHDSRAPSCGPVTGDLPASALSARCGGGGALLDGRAGRPSPESFILASPCAPPRTRSPGQRGLATLRALDGRINAAQWPCDATGESVNSPLRLRCSGPPGAVARSRHRRRGSTEEVTVRSLLPKGGIGRSPVSFRLA